MNDIQALCEALAVADAEQAKEDTLTARLTAADALAEVAQRMSNRMLPATSGEPEFTVDPQDVAELDAALRQYREACDK